MKAPMPMPLATAGEMVLGSGGFAFVEVGCVTSVVGFGLVVSGEFESSMVEEEEAMLVSRSE